MQSYQAFILGLVEGLTEFLPISSTGHLLLLQKYWNLQGKAHQAFAIVIQAGALLAAILYYRHTYAKMIKGLFRKEKESQQLFLSLVIASFPVLSIGYVLRNQLESVGENIILIAIALIIGGVLMVIWEWIFSRSKQEIPLSELSRKQAFVIGLFQTLALWPGMSRSMTSMLGGRIAGLHRVSAADFAFLLALPTLGTVTLYKAIQAREQLATLGVTSLSVGLITSFVMGGLVITAFLKYLKRFSLAIFGYYRVAFGFFVLLWKFLAVIS